MNSPDPATRFVRKPDGSGGHNSRKQRVPSSEVASSEEGGPNGLPFSYCQVGSSLLAIRSSLLILISTTPPIMIPAATRVRGVTDSPRMSQPNATATSGLTYAEVATLDGVVTRNR